MNVSIRDGYRGALRGCGAEAIPGKRFCADCGAPLTGPQVTSARSRQGGAGSRSGEAERRQVTVLFCDMVDATALSERLDPEDLRDVVLAYQAVAAREIEARDGHVAQYLGDGILAYFGYPVADEADARRAVQTGLAIASGIAGLNRRLEADGRPPIAVRIGIHTGLVVIGEMGGGGRLERLAVGETPNIAARLQGLAPPGGVVVSEPTYRLIENLFDVEVRPGQRLKGLSATMAVYTISARVAFEVGSTCPSHRGSCRWLVVQPTWRRSGMRGDTSRPATAERS